MTTRQMTVDEIITEYQNTSVKIREFERYRDTLNKKIQEYMVKKGRSSVNNADYQIRLISQSRETVNKRSLPPDLWEKYKTEIKYNRLSVTKVK